MHSLSWKDLLAEPGPDSHIVQLYQDEEFYGEAISHFAAEGLVRGESIILVASKPNWKNISARLSAKGFQPDRLFAEGQLTLLDADAMLPSFMRGNVPDGTIFKPLAKEAIAKARRGGKFPRVRWWGEMVNVLYVDGNPRGSNHLEQFFDQVAHEEQVAVFCSFLMDKFDPKIYDEAFGHVCSTHSHVIPADDYSAYRASVDSAIEEVMGEIRGSLLRKLMSWQGAPTLMPSSQAMLLWIREAFPEKFEEVLACARAHERANGGAKVAA